MSVGSRIIVRRRGGKASEHKQWGDSLVVLPIHVCLRSHQLPYNLLVTRANLKQETWPSAQGNRSLDHPMPPPAICKGDHPLSSVLSTSAPFANKYATTSRWPPDAAQCNGVRLSCARKGYQSINKYCTLTISRTTSTALTEVASSDTRDRNRES